MLLSFLVLVVVVFIIIVIGASFNGMRDEPWAFVTAVLFIVLFIMLETKETEHMQREATRQGFAHYDQVTGEFVWDNKEVETLMKNKTYVPEYFRSLEPKDK